MSAGGVIVRADTAEAGPGLGGVLVHQGPVHEPPRHFTAPDGGQVVIRSADTPRTAAEAGRAWLSRFLDSPHTFRSYERSLAEWFDFCAAACVDPLAARRPLVEAFKGWLFDGGRTPATVGQRLTAISSFYVFCADEQVIGHNPVKGVRRPRLSCEPRSTGLDRDELRAFLEAARRRHPMTYALMCLLAFNGLRASEPGSIDVEDLGSVHGHRAVALLRKGRADKSRIPLAPVTWRAIEQWLPIRAAALNQYGLSTGPLFLSFNVQRDLVAAPPGRRAVHRWVRQVARDAGLLATKPRLHPHDLRHAFVTLSLDAGVPLHRVQDSAGHATPLTTQRYNRHRHQLDRHATYELAAFIGLADQDDRDNPAQGDSG